MANIFSLYGSIFIDNEKANKSIDDTTNKAENSGSKVGKAFSTIGKGAAIVGTAAISGATVLAGAAVEMVKKTSDAASAINDSSIKVGMSAEEYQKWAYAAKQSGMETEKLDGIMGKQQKTFALAKDGSKTAGEGYAQLGIDISKVGDSEQAFNMVMTKLAGMTDETQRNAISSKIFGKSYADMNVLLAEGADGMNKMKQEAVDLGAVMSNDTVKAGDNMGDTIDKLKAAGMGLFNSVASKVLPIAQKLADLVIANLPLIQDMITQLAPVIAAVFEQLLPPLLGLVQQIFPVLMNLIMALLPPIAQIITALLPIIIQLINTLLPPIIQIVNMILPLLISLIMPLLPLLQPLLQLLTPLINLLLMILEPLIQLLNMILPPLIQVIAWLIEKALVPLQGAFTLVSDIIGSAVSGAFNGIKGVVENVIKVFKGIVDFIKNVFAGDWQGAWENIKNIFSSVFDGIKAGFKIPINWIIDGMNAFIRGINKIKIPDWVPAVGGKGFSIPEFKPLRIGMEYVPSDDFPALLHRGEQVLTAGEARAKRAQEEKTNNQDSKNGNKTTILVKIDKFINNRKEDVEQLVDEVLEIAEEKRKSREKVFS